MVDYIAVLAVGIALFIGLILLMFKRFRTENFLICHIDEKEGRMLTQKEIKEYKRNKG